MTKRIQMLCHIMKVISLTLYVLVQMLKRLRYSSHRAFMCVICICVFVRVEFGIYINILRLAQPAHKLYMRRGYFPAGLSISNEEAAAR